MITASEQLDKRYAELGSLSHVTRPSRGWIRAIREALGMTSTQFAKRLGVRQPRVIEMERGEATGKITVQSLERAAEAMSCRLVYLLVPEKPLTKIMEERASQLAKKKLASIDQTMRLEDQEVHDPNFKAQALQRLTQELLRQPARLWDET
jgi:predicted DNA-binding mobile mystery protein A